MRRGAHLILTAVVFLTTVVGMPQLVAAQQSSTSTALIDVPFEAQTELLCGGAALSMVMRYWTSDVVTASDFSSLVDTRARGISTSALLDAAKSRGYTAVQLDPAKLTEQISLGRPVIALLKLRASLFHYVVVVAMTPDRVIVHDPARAPFQVIDRKDFDAESAGADRWMALVLPTGGGNAHVPSMIGQDKENPLAAPTPCTPYVDAAVTAAGNQRVREAAAALDAAMTMCPLDPAGWRERAGLAFSEKDYATAARLSQTALALNTKDAYTRSLAATSLFLLGDQVGAMEVWGSRRVTAIDVTGAERIPQPLLLSSIGIAAGDTLTATSLARAQRRVQDIPSLQSGKVTVAEPTDTSAKVAVAVIEQPRVPSTLMDAAAIAVRTIFSREVPVTLSLFNSGDRLDTLWGFQKHREYLGAEFSLPTPGTLPGIITLGVFGSRQTFATDVDAQFLEESRRRASVQIADWTSGHLKWRGGLALDRFDGHDYGAISAGLDVRFAEDHAALGVNTEQWKRTNTFNRTSIDAEFRSTTSMTGRRWLVSGAVSQVSATAPYSVWPGADSNFSREGVLRAHPLINDGVVVSDVFGRRLAAMTVTYEHPVYQSRFGLLLAAGFVDTAHAWQPLRTLGRDALTDVGVGLRLRSGGAGTLRLDVAVGVNDGRARVSAGFAPNWPR